MTILLIYFFIGIPLFFLIPFINGLLTSSKEKEDDAIIVNVDLTNSSDEDRLLDYEKRYCWNCVYFDGYDLCTHKKNFGAIGNDSVIKCVKSNLFKK